MTDVGEPIEVQAVVVVRIFPGEIVEAGGSVLQATQNLLGSTGACVLETVVPSNQERPDA